MYYNVEDIQKRIEVANNKISLLYLITIILFNIMLMLVERLGSGEEQRWQR